MVFWKDRFGGSLPSWWEGSYSCVRLSQSLMVQIYLQMCLKHQASNCLHLLQLQLHRTVIPGVLDRHILPLSSGEVPGQGYGRAGPFEDSQGGLCFVQTPCLLKVSYSLWSFVISPWCLPSQHDILAHVPMSLAMGKPLRWTRTYITTDNLIFSNDICSDLATLTHYHI